MLLPLRMDRIYLRRRFEARTNAHSRFRSGCSIPEFDTPTTFPGSELSERSENTTLILRATTYPLALLYDVLCPRLSIVGRRVCHWACRVACDNGARRSCTARDADQWNVLRVSKSRRPVAAGPGRPTIGGRSHHEGPTRRTR